MDRNAFFQAVGEGKISSVYCFQGPEETVKKLALERLREKLLPPGLEALNETILEGATAAAITDACETLPMLADRRLVVVRDWAPLLAGKSRNETEEGERMLAWLSRAPESCCLVFYMRESCDTRKKAAQQLLKLVTNVDFSYLTDAELAKWVRARLKKQGKSIAPEALDQLVFMAGRALSRLGLELDKLAAYPGARAEIQMADIEALVAPSLEGTVFQMTDALFEKKLARAEILVNNLLETGQSRLGIIMMLTRQMRMLLHIKRLTEAGQRLEAVAKEMDFNPYAAKKTYAQSRRYNAEALEAGYRACVEADYAVKSGGARETIALDRLLLTLGAL